ncbi:MAG: hypothetical protein ACE5FD_07135 [Anaerolineae bacterium]
MFPIFTPACQEVLTARAAPQRGRRIRIHLKRSSVSLLAPACVAANYDTVSFLFVQIMASKAGWAVLGNQS